ncbi:terpene synthase family protein [Echinicola sp. 20G]|uniref:terpene synthase family protein n=1 Tax=Echinicola sp. 20G TaxID=2781961 RepID=UPI001910CE38|nr:terpene synthase family protein [Echinicola sp. 20G]
MNYETLNHGTAVPLLNPSYEPVSERVYEWAKRKGLFIDENEFRCCRSQKLNKFAARLFPKASKVELEQIMRLFLILFCLDDRADQLKGNIRVQFWKELLHQYSAIKKNIAYTGTSAIIEVFQEVHWGWFRQCAADKELGVRLINYVRKFLKAGLWEAKNLATNTSPTVIEYFSHLKHCSGAGIAIELLAYLNIYPFGRLVHHPHLAPLYQTIVNLICLSNDLSSYVKEAAAGDFHNLILLKEQQYRISREQSIERVKQHLAFHQKIFLNQVQLVREIPNVSPSEMELLVKAINELLKGMELWAREDTGRYK